MSQMSGMAMAIEELCNATAAINDVADWPSHQFSGEPTKPETAPANEPELKREDVRAVLRICPAKGTRQRSAPCFRSTVPQSSPVSIQRTTVRS